MRKIIFSLAKENHDNAGNNMFTVIYSDNKDVRKGYEVGFYEIERLIEQGYVIEIFP